jgi:hypothetical protein
MNTSNTEQATDATEELQWVILEWVRYCLEGKE